jgi:ABC-2 type transport system ATP-binding protein
MSSLAIEATRLSKTYHLGFIKKRRVQALNGLELTVKPGHIYGLLGPNGAGKSTTIKLLLNLIRPTAGRATIFGHAPESIEARRMVGFLPENPAPYEYLTGEEFVTLAAQLAGVKSGELKSKVNAVIERVGMSQAKGIQIRRYSKGMTQRISLAQALVNEPKLLILDEPTSGLDVLGRQLIRDLISDERRKGTTVLFCSHIIPDVEALCDRVAVLIGGKLVQEGTVQGLLESGANAVEITVEGLSEEQLTPIRPKVSKVETVGSKVALHCTEQDSNDVLQLILSSKGKVLQMERTRFSLEELFIQTIVQSGQKVGSQVL